MPKEAGDVPYTNAIVITFDSDGALRDGDAVTVTGNQASAGDASDLTGVTSHGADDTAAGDAQGIVVSGTVFAQVASGVTQGSDLGVVDTSATGAPQAGTLIASAGGPAHALSDEGGTFQGYTLPAGVAAVKVR